MVSVRVAKDRLSELLESVAAGGEVVIASHGRPKARLVPAAGGRKPFRVDWDLLGDQATSGAPGRPAEDLVREDRDSRP